MTPFGALPFFCILSLVLLPAVVLGLCGKSLRVYGFAATVLMLLVMFDTWQARLTLVGFWTWQTVLCFAYLRLRKVCGKRWVLWLFLLASLLPLLTVKLSALVPMLRWFALMGVSYMSFRAVQILLEIYDGYITELNLLDFSYFLLFFPSVSSGPVDRYRRFCDDIRCAPDKDAYREQLTVGVWKLMQGLLYNFVLGQLIWNYWLAPLTADGFLPTLSYMYGYTFYMFFNFAGYSRMAIGTAYLLGVKLPENFDRPFASVDMKDFWARWHISLSTWLRDYLYTRFCMAALKGKWFKNRRAGSYVGYFITMITMGLWHGFTVPYLVYGAYHGILMSANDVLDMKWKAFKKFKKQPAARAVMMFVTFHLFSFGLLIFSGRLFA